MASTPPPPRRIHTPPTPLHGPKFDNYEPYSPRRSSRVAAQQNKGTPSPRISSSPLKNSASTPPSTTRSGRTRASNQTFSPPSSPTSPSRRVLVISPKDSSRRGRSAKQSRSSPLPASDSDTDILPEKETHRRTSSKDTFGMLNTPSKTPSRRHKETNLNGTARLLFGDNEGTLAPTPRKLRNKSRLDPFSILEDDDVRPEPSSIEIYTDTKERVPKMDDDDSNPFLTKNAAKPSARSRAKKKSARDTQIEEATKNDEGVVYVFRGKKIFRKFDEPVAKDNAAHASDISDDNLSDMDIRRKAGPAASRPFLRSSIKPRLLFPNEEQRREREEKATEADEEALTDIEMPQPSSSLKELSTPTKVHFDAGEGGGHIATPPTTARAKRVKAIPDEQLKGELVDALAEEQVKKKKRSAFDAFPRRKVGSAASTKGTKREGSPVGADQAAKRTRSAISS
ncbi:uncharacterized protein PV09_01090 [Verruconis gallopava]|uniref:Uncharacterized protein n=1 Tax=Verruconis gallopava TaxID=253628 RepID=A0A0D1Z599_9PEZI|nr:uncharacterized protein PV09_01090 [Verruconis gallopava]KIW08157.1 hypothetical protein PV09_01090 [Verruconis gallopava]